MLYQEIEIARKHRRINTDSTHYLPALYPNWKERAVYGEKKTEGSPSVFDGVEVEEKKGGDSSHTSRTFSNLDTRASRSLCEK